MSVRKRTAAPATFVTTASNNSGTGLNSFYYFFQDIVVWLRITHVDRGPVLKVGLLSR